MERTSSRKTCKKAQPWVEENGLSNGYDNDDDDDDDDDDYDEPGSLIQQFSILTGL